MNSDWETIKAEIENSKTIEWQRFFDERQMKEIRFDRIYAADFSHGTDGHNARLIIAKMAQLLDIMAYKIEAMKE